MNHEKQLDDLFDRCYRLYETSIELLTVVAMTLICGPCLDIQNIEVYSSDINPLQEEWNLKTLGDKLIKAEYIKLILVGYYRGWIEIPVEHPKYDRFFIPTIDEEVKKYLKNKEKENMKNIDRYNKQKRVGNLSENYGEIMAKKSIDEAFNEKFIKEIKNRENQKSIEKNPDQLFTENKEDGTMENSKENSIPREIVFHQINIESLNTIKCCLEDAGKTKMARQLGGVANSYKYLIEVYGHMKYGEEHDER